LCGKAYDPALILAWPNAKYAVMGADQAADTLLALKLRDAEREGKTLTQVEIAAMKESIRNRYEAEADIRYGAARGWVDAIVPPHETRRWLRTALDLLSAAKPSCDNNLENFRTGVLQV